VGPLVEQLGAQLRATTKATTGLVLPVALPADMSREMLDRLREIGKLPGGQEASGAAPAEKSESDELD